MALLETNLASGKCVAGLVQPANGRWGVPGRVETFTEDMEGMEGAWRVQ